MGSPCKLLRPSRALPPGLGGFRSATAGRSTGASGHCLARRGDSPGAPDARQRGEQREIRVHAGARAGTSVV